MDEFCGDVKHAWGPTAKGYLTHCFDDLILFGFTYVFIFVFGSHRVWKLLRMPTVKEFPYSTKHSIKVMLIGWLGLMPMVLFAFRYAQRAHDDFEWISKPLASLAWLYSLWILNMETARDLAEGWVLRTFFVVSAVAATASLPTVVLQAELRGYSAGFYIAVGHYILYLSIAVIGLRWRHIPHYRHDDDQWTEEVERHAVGPGESEQRKTKQGFASNEWGTHVGRLVTLYSPEKFMLGIALLALLISVPLTALAAVVIGRLFNNFYYPYAPESSRGHLTQYCLVIAGIYCVSCLLEALYSTLVFVAGEKMASRTRRKLFHAILRQDASFFDSAKPSELVHSIQKDVAVVVRSTSQHLFHGAHCTINVLLCTSVMFLLSWKMALVVLSLAPICVLMMKVQRHFTGRLSADRTACLSSAGALMWESLANIRAVRAFAAEDPQVEEYKRRVGDVYELSFQSGLLDSTSKSVVTLSVQFSIVLTLYVGGIVVMSRQMEIGYLVTFVIITILAVSAAGQLPKLIKQLSVALTATEHIFALLDMVPEMNTKGMQVIDDLQGKIQMEDVSFSYPSTPGKPALKSVSLTVEANSTVAVVGKRGSGKSSMVALLQRMYDPRSGTILLDSYDIRCLDCTWLRENVSCVLSDPLMFATSIAQNIAYAVNGATQSQVEAAARFAGVHDTILSFPDGYQALVGDKGVRLTVQQKLQIALARALVAHPKVLLLDETLSGLDSAAADAVMDKLVGTPMQRTTIIFTAYPESVLRVPRILQLEGGVLSDGAGGRGAGDNSGMPRQESEPDMQVMSLIEIVNEVKEAVLLESHADVSLH